MKLKTPTSKSYTFLNLKFILIERFKILSNIFVWTFQIASGDAPYTSAFTFELDLSPQLLGLSYLKMLVFDEADHMLAELTYVLMVYFCLWFFGICNLDFSCCELYLVYEWLATSMVVLIFKLTYIKNSKSIASLIKLPPPALLEEWATLF